MHCLAVLQLSLLEAIALLHSMLKEDSIHAVCDPFVSYDAFYVASWPWRGPHQHY